MSDKTYTLSEIVEAVARHYRFHRGMTHSMDDASPAEAQLVLAMLAWLDEGIHSTWTAEDMAQILVDGHVMLLDTARDFAASRIDEYGNVALY